jgi:hypothetical protein
LNILQNKLLRSSTESHALSFESNHQALSGTKETKHLANDTQKNSKVQTLNNRYVPDDNAWQDEGLYPVVEPDLPIHTWTPVEGHILRGIYRIVPQFSVRNGNEHTKNVMYYLAYNNRAARVEYAFGPNKLDFFLNNVNFYMIAAGNFFLFSKEPPPYVVSSVRVGYLIQRGRLKEAFAVLGKSWLQALQDPNWWMISVTSTAAALPKSIRFNLTKVRPSTVPPIWLKTRPPSSGGQMVRVYRGVPQNVEGRLGQVVPEGEIGGVLSRDPAAAQDAIFNQVGRNPTLTGSQRGGVIEVRIPADQWDELVRTVSVAERSYYGFSRRLSTTEIRVNSIEAARLINNCPKSVLQPDSRFDFRPPGH